MHAGRLARVRSALRDTPAEALLVVNPKDIHYLTGFHGEDSWALVRTRSATIISDRRFETELEAFSGRGVPTKVHIRPAGQRLAEAVAELLGPGETLGIQRAYTTLAVRAALAKAVGARRLKAIDDPIPALRICKDEHEIAQIRKAIRLQEAAIEAVLPEVTPGQTETELAALLEYEMRARGADGVSFSTIIAADANAALPHAQPGTRRLKRNGLLLVDWGARLGGYCGDMTRAFGIGRWPKKMAEIYDIVLEAHDAGVAAIEPGRPTTEVDAAAREVIEDAGFGDEFSHSLGHGLGLDVHEAPRLSTVSKEILEPGMIVTVEPGIYLPGVGGIRIEDDVVVTDTGRRRLSRLPRDREWATLG